MAHLREPESMPHLLRALCLGLVLVSSTSARAEPVAVREKEGLVHGFLSLHLLDGTRVADGELLQTVRGDLVTSRLVFHFKDGSLLDETAVFSQREQFRLISDHQVQRGPTFPQPLELTIDCASHQVTVRYAEKNGELKVLEETLDLPADLANGIVLTLLKNVTPEQVPMSLSMVAATPKPRLVKLAVSAAGEDRFTTGVTARKATHYAVKIELGGLAGVVAPLVGKQPPDTHVWILGGEHPAFVKSEGAMVLDGPLWRIELVSPVWPKKK